MFCPNCGKELPDGSKFCGFCGADIAKELNGGSSVAGENSAVDAGSASASGTSDPGAGSYAGSTGSQSFGGYDPLGNGQGMNQTAGNQYGGQNGNGQYNGTQTGNGQYSGGQFDNSQYNGGQFDNNQFYNPNQQYTTNQRYGGYANVNMQQGAQPPKKSKKGIIAAIVSVVLVLVIGASAVAYHYFTTNKSDDKDDDDKKDKEVATSASTEEDDVATASTTAASDDEEEITGENALELACENLSKAKDYNTYFTYELICNVEAPDEGISGTITENGEFDIITDFDVDSKDPDANILEMSAGTVTRDIFGDESSETIYVNRGDFSGEFITSIEYESGDKFQATESDTVDTVLGFTDYDLYKAKLQDETKDIGGTECYVYVSEDTYDQGGISGVFTPVTGIYNGESDLCTVTIYVSTKDAQIVQVDTEFTDSDGTSLAEALNNYTGAEDFEFEYDTLTYSLEFTSFDTGATPDPDFEDLADKSENENFSFTMYANAMLEEGDFGDSGSDDEFTDTDDSVTKDDDTEYVEDTFGALTYEVPEDWIGSEIDVGEYTGYVYVPDPNEQTILLIMYEDVDMTSMSDSEIKQAIHASILSLCDSYDLSTDDIKKGTVNGGYAENVRGTITESGTTLDMDVMVFETDGTGLGVVIYASEDIENSDYLAQYYHLLETLEF